MAGVIGKMKPVTGERVIKASPKIFDRKSDGWCASASKKSTKAAGSPSTFGR